MEERRYPTHIIPNPIWSKCLYCNTLLKFDNNAQIGRRMTGNPDEYLDFSLGEDEPFLKDDWIKKHEVPNLSTSLLGAAFNFDDFVVKQKGDGDRKWRGEHINFKNFSEGTDYEWIEGKYFVLAWKLIDLDGQKLPYNQLFPKKNDYINFTQKIDNMDKVDRIIWEEYDNLQRNEQKTPFLDLKGEIKINHDPKNLNYWHFTIDMYQFKTETPSEGTKKSVDKALALSMRDILSQTFEFYQSDNEISPIKNWESAVRSHAI